MSSTSDFITNSSQPDLAGKVRDILGSTSKLDILVGYFYFSGFQELYNNLENKKLRILVGMEVETKVYNQTVEILTKFEGKSKNEIRENFYKSQIDIIQKTDNLENPEIKTAWDIYIQKVKDGELEIRQTKNPNHAKLYIFHHDLQIAKGHGNGQIITGSSNLTQSGLVGREEINVNLRDSNNYEVSADIFENLWKESTLLLDKEKLPEFEIKVIEKTYLGARPSPLEIYLRALIELFDYSDDQIIKPSQITQNGSRNFDDLEYQLDAIKEGLKKIKIHNGAIIADVVGLGKSIIASVIAHNLKLKTVVIAPPHLKDQWLEYSKDFDFKAQNSVYSSGKITDALENETSDNHKKLISIDEAHRYRNEKTDDHKNLMELCRGQKVLLLTATPYNNSPADLKALLRLFQIQGSPTIKSVENIFDKFDELNKIYKEVKQNTRDKTLPENEIIAKKKQISNGIKQVLEPIIIRRSRVDLKNLPRYSKDLEKQGIKLSTLKEPQLITYKLDNMEKLYLQTLEKISPEVLKSKESSKDNKKGFKGVRYSPASYVKDWSTKQKEFEDIFGDINFAQTAGRNLAKMMKNLLVRRLESSINAFKETLKRSISTHQNLIKWYEDFDLVPIYKQGNLENPQDLIDFENDDSSNFEDQDELFESSNKAVKLDFNKKVLSTKDKDRLIKKGYKFVNAEDFKDNEKGSYINDLKKDMALLQQILNEWENPDLFTAQDPKITRVIELINVIQKQEPEKKIVIFSEFADTSNYVYEELKKQNFRVLNYNAGIGSKNLIDIIAKNFDASYKTEKQDNEYDILVATDAISEGYNLHRAGAIINYDIPYNPTRVIQRVGRINRINKKMFETLEIYNMFPSVVGKNAGLAVEELATLKMSMIHAILGEDAKVLKSDETDKLETFLNSKINIDQTGEIESWETQHRNVLDEYRNTEYYKKAKEIPNKTRIRRKINQPNQSLVFVKTGDQKSSQTYFQSFDGEEIHEVSNQLALEIFKADSQEKPFEVTEKFKQSYFESISGQQTKITKTPFSAKISNSQKASNWTKAFDFISSLKETHKENSDYSIYLLQLSELIFKYKSLSVIDIDTIAEYKKQNQGVKQLLEILPESKIAKIHKLCQAFDNQPKSVLLIEEIENTN